MTDAIRGILIIGAGLTCGLALVAGLHYFRAYCAKRVKFDLALSLTMIGITGLSLYTLLVTLERLGSGFRWTFPLAALSILALVFGLLGMIADRGRLERWHFIWNRQ